ncbi:hypothetical protein EYF80_007460 [Liparis tanakae]|uniref:Uncharacterized protein n=1 Tax=Liparis tanakae TaxID=230148 RepID=A0A4Z2IWH7_9TELE|nr:hypothetical protein EYF80_007460 [Liparis tanakae]
MWLLVSLSKLLWPSLLRLSLKWETPQTVNPDPAAYTGRLRASCFTMRPSGATVGPYYNANDRGGLASTEGTYSEEHLQLKRYVINTSDSNPHGLKVPATNTQWQSN